VLSELADSEGFVRVLSRGKHLVVERVTTTDDPLVAAIVTADGTVVPLKDAAYVKQALTSGQASDLVGISGGFAMASEPKAVAKVYDVATKRWIDIPLPQGDFGALQPIAAGVHLIVGETLVKPGGTTTPIARPGDKPAFPDAGSIQLWTGKELVVIQRDSAAFGPEAELHRPWAFDPAANTWRALPAPPWCGTKCVFYAPHQGGDAVFAAWTGKEIVVSDEGAVGTAALDPATGTWRKLPAPPFAPELPATVATDAGLVVISTSDMRHSGGLGQQLVLDLAAGTWKQSPLPVTVPNGQYLSVARDDQSAYLLLGLQSDQAQPTLTAVMDQKTGAWRDPTDSDHAAYQRTEGALIPVARLEKG
jgi:hypothetical protein